MLGKEDKVMPENKKWKEKKEATLLCTTRAWVVKSLLGLRDLEDLTGMWFCGGKKLDEALNDKTWFLRKETKYLPQMCASALNMPSISNFVPIAGVAGVMRAQQCDAAWLLRASVVILSHPSLFVSRSSKYEEW